MGGGVTQPTLGQGVGQKHLGSASVMNKFLLKYALKHILIFTSFNSLSS